MKQARLIAVITVGLGLAFVSLALAQAGMDAVGLRAAHSAGSVEPAAPWVVFTPAITDRLPMASNVVTNAGFEQGALNANGWYTHGAGCAIDETGGRGGSRALEMSSPVTMTDTQYVYQMIVLSQTVARPLYLSGWSRADQIALGLYGEYSLVVDGYYMDGTHYSGQRLRFASGTHDWQFLDGYIIPAKPVRSVFVMLLLSGQHSGTAWFDDLTVREVQTDMATFDGVAVATMRPSPPPFGGMPLSLTTGDGLSLTLGSVGGVITGLALSGVPAQDSAHDYASGFFVRDVISQSDFIHVGGLLTQTGNTIVHSSVVTPLGVAFTAAYTATADRITIHAVLSDTTGSDRALTLYFALPVAAEGWQWGNDIRTSRQVAGAEELANLRKGMQLGATGTVNQYPWASLSNSREGIALGLPPDQPRIFRFGLNPVTHQFYVAFDLGLSPSTTQFPGRAWVDLILYRSEGAWGFRAASQGYHDRFPAFFARSFLPEQEGIWVAFSDLALVPHLEDFGIAWHELGSMSEVNFDDAAGLFSFRYLTAVGCRRLSIDNPAVDPNNYDQVMAYVQSLYQSGDAKAEAILSSGFFDANGRYSYTIVHESGFCSDIGCAYFPINFDPDVYDPTYPLNFANMAWNQAARQAYTTTPGLDGEYVDNFSVCASEMDFRTAHFAATDIPLTFRTADRRVGVPAVFAATEFARWLGQDVRNRLGKRLMTNGILADMPWGADLFDVLGTEVIWLENGSFEPSSDARLNYQRTLAFQRPFELLFNADSLDNLSYEMVEQYMQLALLYGLYPSIGYGYEETPSTLYWDTPALYERDRSLFRRYIPLIRRLNTAGWQPVTRAKTSDPAVYIERFGDWPQLYFTLRNTQDVSATVSITVEADALGLPASPVAVMALLANENHSLDGSSASRTLTVTLGPQASEALYLKTLSVYLPVVIASPRP